MNRIRYYLLKTGLLACLFWIFYSSVLFAHPVLVVNNANAPPYTTRQNNGFLDIVVGEALRRAGYTLQLVQQPAERGLLNANSGIIDGDMTRIKGLDKLYPNLVRVPEKLLDWDFTAFSKASFPMKNWQTIYDNPVSLVKGWKIYEKKLEGARYVTIADDAKQMFRLLLLGRVDSVLYERWQGLALIKQLGLAQKDFNTLILEKRPMFFYLNKRYSDLVDKIAVKLRELKSDGFYDKAYKKTLTLYNTERSQ